MSHTISRGSLLTQFVALFFGRDFPIDITDAQICMQTIAGRTINEVFREHMFQLALTFHGGTEVIGYEWGAPSFLHKWSPDDTAQAAIAHSYSQFGGGWSQSRAYDVGTMNDKVYYVRGGMEDWAYCGKSATSDYCPRTVCTSASHPSTNIHLRILDPRIGHSVQPANLRQLPTGENYLQ
jgi:hypothetical protein